MDIRTIARDSIHRSMDHPIEHPMDRPIDRPIDSLIAAILAYPCPSDFVSLGELCEFQRASYPNCCFPRRVVYVSKALSESTGEEESLGR